MKLTSLSFKLAIFQIKLIISVINLFREMVSSVLKIIIYTLSQRSYKLRKMRLVVAGKLQSLIESFIHSFLQLGLNCNNLQY